MFGKRSVQESPYQAVDQSAAAPSSDPWGSTSYWEWPSESSNPYKVESAPPPTIPVDPFASAAPAPPPTYAVSPPQAEPQWQYDMNTGVWSQAGESPAYAVSHQGQIASPQGGSEWQYDMNTGQWYQPEAMRPGYQADPATGGFGASIPDTQDKDEGLSAIDRRMREADSLAVLKMIGLGSVMVAIAYLVIAGPIGNAVWPHRTQLERMYKVAPAIVAAFVAFAFVLGSVLYQVAPVRKTAMMMVALGGFLAIPSMILMGFSRTLAELL